jgi:hypothetical protein
MEMAALAAGVEGRQRFENLPDNLTLSPSRLISEQEPP